MILNLDHYGLYLTGYSINVDRDTQSTLNLTFKSNLYGNDIPFDNLANDMSLMNSIRQSADPAVKEAFDQLMTVMTLTSGRATSEFRKRIQ